jgi:hypothetical protein
MADNTNSTAGSTVSYPIYSAGPDWITVTATAPSVRDDLAATARRLIDRQEANGNQIRRWAFRGMPGLTAGGISVAASRQLVVAQATSYSAYVEWKELLRPGTNCSRLDLQVTVCQVPAGVQLARQAWSLLEDGDASLGKARHRSFYDTRPAGQTLYLGSRKSDVLLRLYDKSAESPEEYPPGCWRYEVQMRHGRAGLTASALCVGGEPGRQSVGLVYDCFSRRGVRPTFSRSGVGLRNTVPATRTDADRTRAWLRTQVKPALQRLLRGLPEGDADRADLVDLLDALERYLR